MTSSCHGFETTPSDQRVSRCAIGEIESLLGDVLVETFNAATFFEAWAGNREAAT